MRLKIRELVWGLQHSMGRCIRDKKAKRREAETLNIASAYLEA